MKKLSIKSIIEFRAKSDRAKKKFASDLKLTAEKSDSESGGDYWISSLSAISNTYKANDLQLIKGKIEELEEKFDATDYKTTKAMYKRNIDVLYQYEDFDFKKWQPAKKLTFQKKHKADSILTIKDLQVQAMPSHVFTFKKNEIDEIGAIWFIAKLKGFRNDELGMFADILHRYLKTNFSTDYVINPKYCLAIDVVNCVDVNYSQILKDEIPAILTSTLEEIKQMM